MKNKRISILAGASVLALSLTPFASVSAFSPVSPAEGSTYTLVREVNNVATTVTNTFTYTISAADGNPETVTGYPTSATITFNNAAPVSGKVSATTNLDFSSASFTKVGDYAFNIVESASSDAVNYPVSSNAYTAYISVRNVTNPSTGAPTGAHVATLGGVHITANGNKLNDYSGDDSEVIFSQGVVRTYVSVSKSLTGNAANEDECFEIAVTFTGVVGVNLDVVSTSTCDNPASVSGNGTTSIYLKGGDTATIGRSGSTNEIPIGINYSVTEKNATDYKTYIDGSTTDSKTSATKTTETVESSNFNNSNKISIVNNKEEAPRTGVVFSILPFVIIALVGITGAAYVAKTKKVTE